MHHLTWKDLDGNVMAFADGETLISDVLAYRGKHLATWVWPVKRLTYGHRVAGKLSCMFPINAVIPSYRFFVDGKPEKGSCLVMPGSSNLGRIAHPSYDDSVVFHIPNFFTEKGVALTDLVFSMPSVVQRHAGEIKAAFAAGRS